MTNSLKDLRTAAKLMGYDSDQEIRRVLEDAGLGGRYDGSKYKDYLAALQVRAKKLAALMGRIEAETPEGLGPCEVPGCTGVKEYDREMDRCYGAVYGWRCSISGRSHFVESRWERVKSWYQRNLKVKEPG